MPIAGTEAAVKPRVGCVILAAGRSKRFGRTRSNKLLAAIQGRTLIQQVLSSALRSSARPIVVVTGHQRAQIERALESLAQENWSTRFNRHHRRGMSTSIVAGLSAMPADLDGLLICLGDMPALKPCIIDAMISSLQPGDDAVIARASGRHGNPVLIGRSLFAELAQLQGDVGARGLLQDGRRHLRFIDADRSVIDDIDTRRDWHRYRRSNSLGL